MGTIARERADGGASASEQHAAAAHGASYAQGFTHGCSSSSQATLEDASCFDTDAEAGARHTCEGGYTQGARVWGSLLLPVSIHVRHQEHSIQVIQNSRGKVPKK